MSTNANRDNAVDLGFSTVRFKDLYLSGTIEIENGTRNVGVGKEALNSNTSDRNTALGYRAGYSNTGGYRNVYIGELAGNTNQTGNENVYIGRYAGSIATGSGNTFVGEESGVSQSSGTFNSYLGTYSGSAMQTGSKNTILGRYSGNQDGLDIRTSSNRIVLSDGDGNIGLYIDNSQDAHFDGNVIAYSTTISDERLKTDIVKIESALDKVDQINGYTFTYTADGKKSAGVIAQEVEKVLPSAVNETAMPLKTGNDDLYKSVQYDQLIGLLVEAVKELKAEVAELKGQ